MAIGTSGPQGDFPKSDLRATFESKESGGVSVEVKSKVALYYGPAIEAQALETLKRLGIRNGHLTIMDGGALPFAIEARVEAAVRRSGAQVNAAGSGARVDAARSGARVGTGAWQAARPGQLETPRDHLRRSRLYLPGNQPKLFPNAALHGADGIILDLEDSVHPAEKDGARLLVRNALGDLDWGTTERMVRINQLPLGLEDIEAVVPAHPNLFLVPKVERADQLREVESAVGEASQGGGDGPIWIMPILESALGVENAFEIATACESVVALTIGLEDYTADLGVEKTMAGDESLWARRRLVNAAHAAGIQAIDSVFGDIEDLESLAAYAGESRAMGFTGMGCVHPRQIPVIHESFAPSPEAIEKARRIVAAYEEATANGLGVVSLGSKMIDPPVVARAQKLMAQARIMGLLSEDNPS